MSKTYIPVSLRQLVLDRAQNRCEYCLIPQELSLAKHHIDHIIAEKHGGETVAENLALSCSLCNQAKGSDVATIDPKTLETERLFQPRRDRWLEHFEIQPETGIIQPLTNIAQSTIQILQVNRAEYLDLRLLLLRSGLSFFANQR
jgi:hypothetical protein